MTLQAVAHAWAFVAVLLVTAGTWRAIALKRSAGAMRPAPEAGEAGDLDVSSQTSTGAAAAAPVGFLQGAR